MFRRKTRARWLAVTSSALATIVVFACSSTEPAEDARPGSDADAGVLDTSTPQGDEDVVGARDGGVVPSAPRVCGPLADAGTPPPTPAVLAAEKFCEDAQGAYVDFLIRCGAAMTRDAWMSVVRSYSPCTDVGELVRRGRLIHDAVAGQSCLDAIAAHACGKFMAVPACLQALVGTVPVGEACYETTLAALTGECAPGSYCDRPGSPPTTCPTGICRRQAKIGEACTFWDECVGLEGGLLHGFFTTSCDYATKKCIVLTPAANGEACGPTTYCADDAWCAQGQCQPLPSTGPCAGEAHACARNSRCVGEGIGAPGNCVPYKAAGAACTPGADECDMGLYCSGETSTCAPHVYVPEPCGGTGPEPKLCLDGLCKATSLVDGGFVGQCIPYFADGASCLDAPWACDPRSSCVSGKCRRDCTADHHCGALCEECCGSHGCDDGVCIAGRCGHCGGPGEPCCNGPAPCDGGGCCAMNETTRQRVCVAPGDSCSASSGTCNAGSCTTCGGPGQPCCFTLGTPWCSAGDMCTCIGPASPSSCTCRPPTQ